MNHFQRHEFGFTLVELLIVISIIGILSAIVLSDISTARIKAQDAVVKQNLNSIRTQAGLFYDANTNYTNLCTFPKVLQALDESATLTKNPHNCDAVADAWAADIELSKGGFYCIDGEGNASTTTASKGTATTVCY